MLISEMIARSCLRYGENTAFRQKVAGKWIDHSYRDLWLDSDGIASGLIAGGIEAGDRSAIIAPSSPNWVKAYLGILKAGSIAVPIDKELKQGELRHILSDCEARVLFTEQTLVETIIDILPELKNLKKIVILNSPPAGSGDLSPQLEAALGSLLGEWRRLAARYKIDEDNVQQLEELAEGVHRLLLPASAEAVQKKDRGLLSRLEHSRHRALQELQLEHLAQFMTRTAPQQVERSSDDTAIILYTSGTTGRSKGAMLSHRNITSNIEAAKQRFDLDDSMRMLSFLPINHVFEQVCGILLPLSVGGTVAFAESIKQLGNNLSEVKPNFMLGVPAVFRLLLDRMNRNIEGQALSRTLFSFGLTRPLVLKKVKQALGGTPIFVSGGAALDPAVAEGLTRLGIQIYQGYGITETSPILTVEYPGATCLGTAGPPLPGVEIKIHEPNAEGVGEIWARGPNIMQGYFNNPQATQEVLSDGWYHTGDLGRIEDDGKLAICGRLKNLIVTANGKNVYPEEVEQELLQSPFIAEVMVYGHKVKATVEEVHAMIYPDQDALDDYFRKQNQAVASERDVEQVIRREVLEYGRNLADYKRVRRFTLREDEFPKTTTRKIKRFAVEADIDAEAGS